MLKVVEMKNDATETLQKVEKNLSHVIREKRKWRNTTADPCRGAWPNGQRCKEKERRNYIKYYKERSALRRSKEGIRKQHSHSVGEKMILKAIS